MATLNIGDAGLVSKNQISKKVRITGYWRFKPFSTSEDDLSCCLLKEIIEEEITDGVRERDERIEPCLKDEAHLYGTTDRFFDVKEVVFDDSSEPLNIDFYQSEHNHKISLMAKNGEMALYGRIKLSVSRFSRFFDPSGNLLPEFQT